MSLVYSFADNFIAHLNSAKTTLNFVRWFFVPKNKHNGF